MAWFRGRRRVRHHVTTMEKTPVPLAEPRMRAAPVDSTWLKGVWRLKLGDQGTEAVAVETMTRGQNDLARLSPTPPPSTAPRDVMVGQPLLSGALRGCLPDGWQALRLPDGEFSFAQHPVEPAVEPAVELRGVRAVLRDYCRTTTLHGVALIGNESSGLVERSIWAATTLASAVLLVVVCCMQWQQFALMPTVTTIEQNDVPTYEFPFPAVTVCPKLRLKMPTLANIMAMYLRDYVGGGALLTNSTDPLVLVSAVFRTLSDFRYPSYRQMKWGLYRIGRMLPFLDGLAISRVMMQARLTCNNLLAHCYWKGIAFECCEQFQLQRTEMGYCMSFNSRTSTGPKILCSERNCHHVWSTGPSTGLMLVFKKDIFSGKLWENTTDAARSSHSFSARFRKHRPEFRRDYKPPVPGPVWESEDIFLANHDAARMDHILVMVHDRKKFPDITKAISISTKRRNDYSIAVAFSTTAPRTNLRNLPPESRHCLFNGEVKIEMARSYSQSECIAECRVMHIVNKCGCRPYFIESYGGNFYNNIPECRFSLLPCVSGLNLVAVNCSHCTMACGFSDYAVRVYPSINVNIRDANLGSTIEISYDTYRTAVLYRQQITFGLIEMLVALGGLASLCLGCSVLTGLDLIHLLARVARASLGYTLKPIYQKTRPGWGT